MSDDRGQTHAASEAATRPARASSTEPLSIGHDVGPYRLVDELGRGGMGTVYLARDPRLNRDVALKVVRSDRSGDEGARLRMVREAQAMGRVSHPNVVPVYDAGTTRGQVFIAMEHCSGTTLAKWLKEQKPGWREILRAFEQAGRGLAAAHGAGLVHRDFKPQNVMVSADRRRVQVMDFGLAVAPTGVETDPTSAAIHDDRGTLTATGVVMGTPVYMSPEQHRGDPTDARSDQYSFCVALYEALYGKRPFSETDVVTMVEDKLGHRLDEPRKTRVPGRVLELIRRGLEPEPASRWPTIEVLLDGLGRVARPPRRLGAALGAGCVTVGAIVWVTLDAGAPEPCSGIEQSTEAVWGATRRGLLREGFEATAEPYAARAAAWIDREIDEYVEVWRATHQQACEAARRGELDARALDRTMGCLQDRLDALDAMISVLLDADARVVERAYAIVGRLGSVERCADIEALRADIEPPRDSETSARVAEVRRLLASVRALFEVGRYPEALALAQAGVPAAVETGYPPVEPEAIRVLASAHYHTGEYRDADRLYVDAFYEALAVRHDRVAAAAALDLAQLYGYHQARFEESDRWLRQAEAILGRGPPGWSSAGHLLATRGTIQVRRGDYSAAIESLTAAANLVAQHQGPDHPNVGKTLLNVAMAHFYLEDLDLSERYLQRGLTTVERSLGPRHPETANAYNGLASLHLTRGNWAESEHYLKHAVFIWSRHAKSDHTDLAMTLSNLGTMYDRVERYALSRAHHERALAMRERALGLGHPDVGQSLFNLGDLLITMEEYALARDRFRAAAALLERAFDLTDPRVAHALRGLALAELGLGSAESARPFAERALAIRERDGSPASLATARFALGRILWELGERDRGVGLVELAHTDFIAVGVYYARERSAAERWLASHELASKPQRHERGRDQHTQRVEHR